jgi:hypothetical protein
MHKWIKLDRSTVVLCTRCCQKEYKKLDIRDKWSKAEMNREFTCERCGKKMIITNTSSD